jgi:hypothetical protein
LWKKENAEDTFMEPQMKMKPGKSSGHNREIEQVLVLLEEHFRRLADEAYLGKEMLREGALTGFVKQLEEGIQNPIATMVAVSQRVNSDLQRLLALYFVRHISGRKDLLQDCFISVGHESLSFFLVLKKDTPAHRDAFFAMLREFEASSLSRSFRVHFYFIPRHEVVKFESLEKVVL